jgi:hypothetical protein
MVAATHRLEAVEQAATPMAVQAVMPQLAKTTVDQRVTKEWLTIAATIGFRRVIVTAGRIRTASRDNDNRDNGHRDHRHGHFVSGVWVWYGAPFASNDCSWLRHRAMPRAALIGGRATMSARTRA